jgi:hypothetical protein
LRAQLLIKLKPCLPFPQGRGFDRLPPVSFAITPLFNFN